MFLDIVEEKIIKQEPVKLHLGCGTVMMDGYINVDGDYMKDKGYPITYHDITKEFPLPNNCVDEILSIHVIEHFPRNIVSNIMKEWLRILKPGGFVATEWPDTLKACQEIVKNPAIMWSNDRRALKRTMYVFWFDDSRYDDVAMMHRWGYSEDSLGRLFVNNGFSRYIAEPNKHGKTLNDSRIVAYK